MNKEIKLLLKCFARAILTIICACIIFNLMKFAGWLLTNYLVVGICFLGICLILFLTFLFWLGDKLDEWRGV